MFVTPKLALALFSVSLGELKWPQEKLKTILKQNSGVTNKEHYGMLSFFLEWSITGYVLRFRSLLRNLTGEQYEDVINVCSMLPIVEMKVKPHGEFGSI